ncbi:hypothetical protein [Nocardioides sp. URHA0032]|uniref:hypothetical protein n=1 Tax=Nocardioides sp. URHA0032 TaxID=1380388 RepID=UPI000490DD6D|nr:hypothetical protein [Nocardioides sp. URHA0032]
MSTATVVHTKERLSGVVQSVGRRPSDVPRRWWESALVFLFFTVGYTWFGYWVVVDQHVVGFETLDRLNRALMVWHNDPAKLSAIGFDYPPLATLLIAPLAVFRGFVTSMAAVPLASAIFAAITMVGLNTMMRRALVAGPLRYALLLALGANPLVLLYATTGTRHFVWIAFVVTGLGSLFAWYITADVRFVMLAGIAYSVAALSGYSSLTFFVLSAIMIGAILARLGADGTEVEGTVVGFAAPTVYVIALWTVFNLVLLLSPFSWITRSSDAASSGGLEMFSAVDLLRATGELVLYGAPIAIIVLPALIFSGFARGNPFALWLGVLLGAAILTPALAVALRLTDSPMLMRNALPILLLSVVGAIWLARSAEEGSTLVAAVVIVGLLVSIPWTLNEMKTYRFQNLEAPFAAALTTGESQEGAETLNGEKVGIVSEQAMAEYIRNNVSQDNSILTDNAQTYAVMMLTGHPELFFDRVDRSDGPWKEAARNPAEYVDYLLMSTADNGDLLTKLYPDAAAGNDAQLQVVYSTPRYVLVGVPAGFSPDQQSSQIDQLGQSS